MVKMENNINHTAELNSQYDIVARAYELYSTSILNYIKHRINRPHEAEDMVQDVFLHSLLYKSIIRDDTVRWFLYSIARNLIVDKIRRHYKHQRLTTYYYDYVPKIGNDTDQKLLVGELKRLEAEQIRSLSTQRRKVYVLNRFGDNCSEQIALSMSLSKRTVEHHLLSARTTIRERMRMFI